LEVLEDLYNRVITLGILGGSTVPVPLRQCRSRIEGVLAQPRRGRDHRWMSLASSLLLPFRRHTPSRLHELFAFLSISV
jgi:hypothetical protein